MDPFHRSGAGAQRNTRSRRALLTLPAALLALATAACTGPAPQTQYVGSRDSKALTTCELLFNGTKQDELVGAVDSTIARVREISIQSGLDPTEDPNLNGAPDDDYAALCLIPINGKRYVFYQLEVAARGGAIGVY